MKTTFLSTVFVLIGAISLTASACGNDAHADRDQHQMKDGAKAKNGFDGMPALGTKALCPVMNNEFKVKKDSSHSVYKGKTYVFCCPGCKPKFDENPDKYMRNARLRQG